ncbi:glycosyltransferase [Candidatus Haliotispira prima]|uniref:Glycosyltransferase n=1 Tax=Candidatus Haliotispira prima TaxID=3034016 RepID=A0ABY8MNI6_9SPIO|nr:glycosyltransferase [Candidatus Haliotispira prima]
MIESVGGRTSQNRPLISIVTVVLNCDEFLEGTILSVLSQDFNDFQYIIIDGGSTDTTLDIIKKYEDRIDYWVSEKDDGVYHAMNKGISLCSGEIIGLINADDWYEKGVFKTISEHYRKDKNKVYYGNLNIIQRETDTCLYNSRGLSVFKMRDLISELNHPTVFVPSAIYKKYGTFNTKYSIIADQDLLFRLFTNKVPFQYVDSTLANHRTGGLSGSAGVEAEKEMFRKEHRINDITQKCGQLPDQITVKLAGGLGNQIWQYMAAVALAARHKGITGESPSVVVDNSYYKDGHGGRPFLLNKIVPGVQVRSNVPEGYPDGYIVYREPEEFAFSENFLTLPPAIILEGYFQHYRYFELAKSDLNLQLKPMPEKYRALQKSFELVALHVRRGDYTTISHHGLTPTTYYYDALSRIRQSIARPYVLIFTDDIPWTQANLTDIDLPYDFPSGSVIDDFSLMTQCRHFITANSSYSILAALFGSTKESLVFMPRMHHLSLNVLGSRFLPQHWQTPAYPFCIKPSGSPLVSVIIPVYNTREYLNRCLESACLQTEPNIEIIIVDDASPDNSRELIEEYAARDSRITSIRHKENKHLGGARNTGIEAAKGEWLLFLDSDDYIRLDMVEIFLQKTQKYPGVELFTCQIMSVRDGNFELRLDSSSNCDVIIEKSLENLPFPCACAKLWKRDLWMRTAIRFPEHMTMEDLATTPRLFQKLHSFVALPDRLFFYQQRSASITGAYSDNHAKDSGKAFDLLLDWGEEELSDQEFILFRKRLMKYYKHALMNEACRDLHDPFGRDYHKAKERMLKFLQYNQEITVDFLLQCALHPPVFDILTSDNRWFRFGRYSHKRKLWVIAKVLSQKIGVYSILRPVSRLVAKRIVRYLKR